MDTDIRVDGYPPAKPPLTGETLNTLAARLAGHGEPAFRAKQILDWLYQKRARSWDEMTNLSKPLRTWLANMFDFFAAADPRADFLQFIDRPRVVRHPAPGRNP